MWARISRTAWCFFSTSTLLVLTAPSGVAHEEAIEGFLEPVERITVSAREPGVVNELSVREGDVVEVGTMIAQLDDSVLRSTLDVARAKQTQAGKLDAAMEELRFRKERFGRLQTMASAGHATRGELERAESSVSVAESSRRMILDERELQGLEVERIGRQLELYRILSPLRGVVEKVYIRQAEMVTIQDSRIATVINIHRLQVKFPVPLSQRQEFTLDKQLELEIQGTDRMVDGKVTAIAPVADARSATITVTVSVDNQDEGLTIGSRCSVVAPERPQVLKSTSGKKR
jgi:RND family efflux transporter MFP subunit